METSNILIPGNTHFADENSEGVRHGEYLGQQNEIETRYRNANPNLFQQDIRDKWQDSNPLGKIEHQSAWAPDGYIGEWVSENQIVAKIQDYLFAHGGYSQKYTSYSLDEMNAAGKEALIAQNWNKIQS